MLKFSFWTSSATNFSPDDHMKHLSTEESEKINVLKISRGSLLRSNACCDRLKVQTAFPDTDKHLSADPFFCHVLCEMNIACGKIKAVKNSNKYGSNKDNCNSNAKIKQKVLNIKCSGLFMSYVNSQVKITYYRHSHQFEAIPRFRQRPRRAWTLYSLDFSDNVITTENSIKCLSCSKCRKKSEILN